MGRVYRELSPIPFPPGALLNRSDARVYLLSKRPDGRQKRTTIGYAVTETSMQPNDMFRQLFPALWQEHYGEEVKPSPPTLHAGMYALSLGIGHKTGLYPLLHQSYGPLYANALMDYANYSILEHSNVSQHKTDSMSRQVLYSKKPYSDSWLSDLFAMKLTDEMTHQFKVGWLAECKARGLTNVWLSIDASNHDCSAVGSKLAQKGKAKSGQDGTIVSYIYAVDAKTGLPVTWFTYNGSIVDCKAFQKIASFLGNSGIMVEGVILDRGFCTHDVLCLLQELGYPYVVMLKSDCFGHRTMMELYADKIHWNVRYCVNDKGMFGIQDKVQLFKAHPEEGNVSLFFDGPNGSARAITLIQKIKAAANQLLEQARQGKETTIPADLKSYLFMVEEAGQLQPGYHYERWQMDVNEKGYSSIATSANLDAAKTNNIYHLRDASETQYSILKTQLSCHVRRTHTTQGIENKLALAFIAAIIRSHIMTACQKLKQDTNKMLGIIDRISLIRLPDGSYSAVNDLSDKQKRLLAEFDICNDDFLWIAQDVNFRKAGPLVNPMHVMPGTPRVSKKRGRPPKQKAAAEETAPRRKPGRPKGSKNKATLLREAQNAKAASGPRKPGRPKGSKNKAKTTAEQQVKRGPGRPSKVAGEETN